MNKTAITRRNLLRQVGYALILLPAPAYLKKVCAGIPAPRNNHMQYKGVNYDTGTNFSPGNLSADWDEQAMQFDIRVIRRELHCNAVNVFGTDIPRLTKTAAFAAAEGLQVWIQPRLFHSSQDEMLTHLSIAAREAEQLRQQYPGLILNTGCESSLFVSGIIPGDNMEARVRQLTDNWQSIPAWNEKLNAFLVKVSATARAGFKGTITYAAGPWESVSWQLFDIIGLDYYREATNEKNYAEALRAFHQYGKPVVITEFGCCTYEGADKKGAAGHEIIDWKNSGPEIKTGYIRSEKTQADYLRDLFSIYQREKVHGAFVYVFNNAELPHAAATRYDLDMGSYSLVKALPADSGNQDVSRRWERKASFHAVAAMFRDGHIPER
ncbi:abortive infection protein [Chitinophaga solisilvae]|uniref:abortive infection protein n=1 Tax=Chitinophaga solisilvae TaxID=1233460 RepID=UPI00136ADA1C|nr:abortive infection protein [Chitinophaga solisilvae]